MVLGSVFYRDRVSGVGQCVSYRDRVSGAGQCRVLQRQSEWCWGVPCLTETE